jgi:hypothetical protein
LDVTDGIIAMPATHAMMLTNHTTARFGPFYIMLNMRAAVRIDTIEKFALIGIPQQSPRDRLITTGRSVRHNPHAVVFVKFDTIHIRHTRFGDGLINVTNVILHREPLAAIGNIGKDSVDGRIDRRGYLDPVVARQITA